MKKEKIMSIIEKEVEHLKEEQLKQAELLRERMNITSKSISITLALGMGSTFSLFLPIWSPYLTIGLFISSAVSLGSVIKNKVKEIPYQQNINDIKRKRGDFDHLSRSLKEDSIIDLEQSMISFDYSLKDYKELKEKIEKYIEKITNINKETSRFESQNKEINNIENNIELVLKRKKV